MLFRVVSAHDAVGWSRRLGTYPRPLRLKEAQALQIIVRAGLITHLLALGFTADRHRAASRHRAGGW